MVSILGQRAPLMLDSMLPEVKHLQRPILTRLVERRADLETAQAAADAEIERRGYPLQVKPQPGLSPLFMLHGQARRRIAWADGGYTLRGTTDAPRPLDQLQQILAENPAVVSPGVLARPAVQDALLGTTLQIMGPAELSYMAQVAPVYPLLGIEPPWTTLRPQVLVLEERQAGYLEENSISLAEFLDMELDHLVSEKLGDDLIGPARQQIEAILSSLHEPLTAVDKGLEGPLRKTSQHIGRGLDQLKGKVAGAVARRHDVWRRRLEQVRTSCLPDGQSSGTVLIGSPLPEPLRQRLRRYRARATRARSTPAPRRPSVTDAPRYRRNHAVKLDVLAIGAHPDDVELCCGATVALLAEQGKKVGILHLTRGELGTRGTVAEREIEAKAAAEALGAAEMTFLDCGDGALRHGMAEEDALIEVLRAWRPEILLGPPASDRHPDHGRAHRLVADAAFYAGLARRGSGPPHRPGAVFSYMQHDPFDPAFIVDVTQSWDRKVAALAAYDSQLYRPDTDRDEPMTKVSSPEYFLAIEGRARHFGQMIGAAFGEPFWNRVPLAIHDVMSLLPGGVTLTVGRAGGLRAGLRHSRYPRRKTARCFYAAVDATALRRHAQTSSPMLAPPTRPLRSRRDVSGRNLVLSRFRQELFDRCFELSHQLFVVTAGARA